MDKHERDKNKEPDTLQKRLFLDQKPSSTKRNSAKYEIEKSSFRDMFRLQDYSRDKHKE